MHLHASETQQLLSDISRTFGCTMSDARKLLKELLSISANRPGCMTRVQDHVFKLRLPAEAGFSEVWKIYRKDAVGKVAVLQGIGGILLEFRPKRG